MSYKSFLFFGALINIIVSENLKFETVNIFEIDDIIKYADKMVVIFFDTLDGKTEEIHR